MLVHFIPEFLTCHAQTSNQQTITMYVPNIHGDDVVNDIHNDMQFMVGQNITPISKILKNSNFSLAPRCSLCFLNSKLQRS